MGISEAKMPAQRGVLKCCGVSKEKCNKEK
jgi:hypothetical protein